MGYKHKIKAMMHTLDINTKLANLLGWRNVVHVSGSLLGIPPHPPNGYKRTIVPDWLGNWSDCAPLLVEHLLFLNVTEKEVFASTNSQIAGSNSLIVKYEDYALNEQAVRYAIVQATINKMETNKNEKLLTNPEFK